jgi:hypothetical protein
MKYYKYIVVMMKCDDLTDVEYRMIFCNTLPEDMKNIT